MKYNRLLGDPMAAAYRMLLRRDHSRAEIKSKLVQRGFEKETVDRVIEELKRRNYLDDEGYARNLVRHYQSIRRFGASRISLELSKKGIPDEIKRDAMEEYDDSLDDENLTHLVDRNIEIGKSKEQIIRLLQGRGYSIGAIISKMGDSSS